VSLAEDVRAEIRLALRIADVSQAELARHIGVSTNHVSRVLTGQQALSIDLAEAMLSAVGRQMIVRTKEIKRLGRTSTV
jgi:plasmid maintenance system antidote protein VapI